MRGRLYRRAPTQAKPKAWYQRDGGGRLAQDRERIAAAFPGLSYQIDEQAGRVFLEGTITLVAECGISTPIQVRVEFPDDYPEHEPRVYDDAQRFPYEADRHFYPDGRCCLWLPPESRWNAKDPMDYAASWKRSRSSWTSSSPTKLWGKDGGLEGNGAMATPVTSSSSWNFLAGSSDFSTHWRRRWRTDQEFSVTAPVPAAVE